MIISLSWLRDYVDIDIAPKELANILTMAGFEVEAVSEKRPSFSGVVTAEIISISPHPQADHLSLCRVSTGTNSFEVVCGAKNIFVGAKVPFAQEGAKLGSTIIKTTRIREAISQGMLCSEAELEIGSDATGILILPEGVSLGEPLEEVLPIRDVIFEINVTPNRPDCLSVLGLAREVAALTGKTLRYPDFTVREGEGDISQLASVEILAAELCPRYSARLILDVKVDRSPLWLRQRLEAVGLRAINNIVDVTNYVMLELGQPLHAFDYDLLTGGRIVVRGAREGESFTTLDGKERTLRADTLMICDGEKPVAVAGIMGGLNSEVREDTSRVLLESAYFNPQSIRRTAKWLGMSTDASFRFERGVDISGVITALNRAARMIAELGGGVVLRNYIDQYPRKLKTAVDIPMRVERVKNVLGFDLTQKEMVEVLRSLEMTVTEDKEGYCLVTPPTFRIDITREVDLIEEIARYYGYDRIPVTLPAIAVNPIERDPLDLVISKSREVLIGFGYTEVINYTFVSPTFADMLNLPTSDPRRRLVVINNPLSDEQSVMRPTIVYSLLENSRRNFNVGTRDQRFFEIGRVFLKTSAGCLPEEHNYLTALLAGSRWERSWAYPQQRADFYDLKGCVSGLFAALKIDDVRYNSALREPFLHPGRSCGILIKEQPVGFLGELLPEVSERFDLAECPILFELDLDRLTGFVMDKLNYQEVSRYPACIRDVAFVVGGEMESITIMDVVKSMKEELLEDVSIFDLYEGPGIPSGTKSLGLRFSYRSLNRTLTDEEVNGIHGKVVKKIIELTGVKIRGIN